jgi:hypothetical protein
MKEVRKMIPVSLQQMPPVARPAFNGDTAPGRVHYLPGPIPTIEQILMKQADRYVAAGNEADNLLNALKQDNHNMEVMLSQLAALAGSPS